MGIEHKQCPSPLIIIVMYIFPVIDLSWMKKKDSVRLHIHVTKNKYDAKLKKNPVFIFYFYFLFCQMTKGRISHNP